MLQSPTTPSLASAEESLQGTIEPAKENPQKDSADLKMKKSNCKHRYRLSTSTMTMLGKQSSSEEVEEQTLAVVVLDVLQSHELSALAGKQDSRSFDDLQGNGSGARHGVAEALSAVSLRQHRLHPVATRRCGLRRGRARHSSLAGDHAGD